MVENNSFREIWDKLKNSKKIIMSLHAGPDGDSMGACTAMKYVLESEGKEVRVVSGDDVSENMRSLDFFDEVEFGVDIGDVKLEDYDILLCLDSADLDRVSGKYGKGFTIPERVFSINMDHHHTNPGYADLNYVNSDVSSTCSLLVDFFRENYIKFDKELSERLLLGICTDSGFFTYNRAEDAMRKAVFLVDKGADYYGGIVRPILRNNPLKMKKFWALIIDRMKLDKERKVAYSIISLSDIEKLGVNLAEIRLGIIALQDIGEGVEFVFILVELNDYIKGSFRSIGNVDVSLFAKELGGGGHKPAAAFKLEKVPLDEAESRVLETIDRIGINRF